MTMQQETQMKTPTKTSKRLCRKLIIVICILLAAIFTVKAVMIGFDIGFSGLGLVTRVSAHMRGKDEMVIRLPYLFATGGYSVRNVPESEGMYVGDGMEPYDGSLGKYRVMINFGDVEMSSLLAARLTINPTLKNSPVKLRTYSAHPSDHGFVLYICSDTPICVENEMQGDLHELGGTVKVRIQVGREEA